MVITHYSLLITHIISRFEKALSIDKTMLASVCKDLLRLTNLSHFLIIFILKKVKGCLYFY
jgi:predicted naringenin-chalcone synthase